MAKVSCRMLFVYLCFFPFIIHAKSVEEVYPVVELDEPIEQQVQLFATDRVKIIDPNRVVKSVWFGESWEVFYKNEEYTVWGRPGVPVYPKFKTSKENSSKSIKLHIKYSANPDVPRDIRERMDDETEQE